MQPTIGIFTNIGEAHSEGFLNIRQKINEKLKLFVKSELLIYCADDPDINEAVNSFQNNVSAGNTICNFFTWSKKRNSNTYRSLLSETRKHEQYNYHSSMMKNEQLSSISIIPFTDVASIENAITCWCVLLHLGIDDEIIAEKMLQLRPVEMRLELKTRH